MLSRIAEIKWLLIFPALALMLGIGVFAGGIAAGPTSNTAPKSAWAAPLDTPTNTPQPTPVPGADSYLYFVPGSAGNCAAPANGGTTQVGCRFVLDMMINTGS